MFCRHGAFWKIGICYALSNGVCDEWLSLIEPIMDDAIKVPMLYFCVLVVTGFIGIVYFTNNILVITVLYYNVFPSVL